MPNRKWAKGLLYQQDEDRKTDEDRPTLSSLVYQNDDDACFRSVLDGTLQYPKSKQQQNYKRFIKHLKKTFDEQNDERFYKKFGTMLMDKLVLLPIECSSFDDALKLFETINNRGMQLTDSDIFKSRLYAAAEDDKEEFIRKWNLVLKEWTPLLIKDKKGEKPDHMILFRYYYYIIRGQKKIKGQEMGLRDFFIRKEPGYLNNWRSTIADLQKIADAHSYLKSEDITPKAFNWVLALRHYTNEYPKYLLIAYLFAHLQTDSEGYYRIADEQEFEDLLAAIAKYAYSISIFREAVNSIKTVVFQALIYAVQGNGRKCIEHLEKERAKYATIKEIMDELQEPNQRIRRGLLYMLSASDPKQKDYLKPDLQVEHILPNSSYNHYDESIEGEWDEYKEYWGNIVLFEKKLNISASNTHFSKKKKQYAESRVALAQELTKYTEWSDKELLQRHKQMMKAFRQIFRPSYTP